MARPGSGKPTGAYMVAIPDYSKTLRTYDNVLGLKSIRDAIEGPASAFLASEKQRQRDIARIVDVGKAADLASSVRASDLASSVHALEDQAHVRSQVEACREVTQMAAQSSFAKNMAETCSVAEVQRRAEDMRCYDAFNAVRAAETSVANNAQRWSEVANVSRDNAFDVAGMLRADDVAQKFLPGDIARASFAESMALAQDQTLQNIVQLAMPDANASLQALVGNMLTGTEAILASLRDVSAVHKWSVDPFAAYGPFIHTRPEPQSWDVWRDKGRNYSWGESDDTRDEPEETLHDYYEQTESGIYVPKGGRPPGPSILTKSRFLETFEACAQMTGRPPTMEGFSEFMETHFKVRISVSTIQRYCRGWNLLWRDLHTHIANC